MKKFLLLTVAALGIFVACEKDEFEALDEAFATQLAAEINAREAGDATLQGNIDDLTSAFNAFVEDINNRLASAVAALEAADDALEAYIDAEIADLYSKMEAFVAELNESIKENTDLIKATGAELRLITGRPENGHFSFTELRRRIKSSRRKTVGTACEARFGQSALKCNPRLSRRDNAPSITNAAHCIKLRSSKKSRLTACRL